MGPRAPRCPALAATSVRAPVPSSIGVALRAGRRSARGSRVDAAHRRAIHADAVLRQPQDHALPRRAGHLVDLKRVQRLMRITGIEGIAPGPSTSTGRDDVARLDVGSGWERRLRCTCEICDPCDPLFSRGIANFSARSRNRTRDTRIFNPRVIGHQRRAGAQVLEGRLRRVGERDSNGTASPGGCSTRRGSGR